MIYVLSLFMYLALLRRAPAHPDEQIIFRIGSVETFERQLEDAQVCLFLFTFDALLYLL